MAASMEAIVQEDSPNEEFHDASTEYFHASNTLEDFQPIKGDCGVQAESNHKENIPHLSETAAELTSAHGDRDTADVANLSSTPPQEDVVMCEGDEVLGEGVANAEDDGTEQRILGDGLVENKEVIAENVSSDSCEGGTAEEKGTSSTVKSPPSEVVADNSEEKGDSEVDDSDSVEEELAYEARNDTSDNEEEEGEQDNCDKEESEGTSDNEEEEGEQDRGNEEESEGTSDNEEGEGDQDKGDEKETEGDGWEEQELVEGADVDTGEKEKKTEKPKDPSVVPRDNRYFLHDMREEEETREDDPKEQDTQVAEEEPKTEADRVERWAHDLYVREYQGPRTEKEKQKDARRFDDTQRGHRRGGGRGFGGGRGQRSSFQDQRHGDQVYDRRDQRGSQRYDSQDDRRDDQNQRYHGQDQRYGQSQRQNDWYQRQDGQDRGSSRDQRHNSRGQGRGGYHRQDRQQQRSDAGDTGSWDDQSNRRQQQVGQDQGSSQDQRYNRDQRYSRDQRYDRDQRYNSRGQRRGGYHRQDRQQQCSDAGDTGSWDDQSNHRQQQRRLGDEEHGTLVAATGQEYDHKQDGQPSYSRGSFVKGRSFHRGGFTARSPRSERSHGDDKLKEKKEGEEEVEELSEAAVTIGKGTEGGVISGNRPGSARMVGKWTGSGSVSGKKPESVRMVGKKTVSAVEVGMRSEGEVMMREKTEEAKDLPQKTPLKTSSPRQLSEDDRVSPKSVQQEHPVQQSEELPRQSRGSQQRSLFGRGTGQEGRSGKERKPTRLYSLARGRPISGVGASATKPGSNLEESSMGEPGKGHGGSSQPRSKNVPGSAYPVRTERSEETVCNDPPVEGEGEGEKVGGPKRYSVQRGSGEGSATQRLVQGYSVFPMMPGDQYAQTTPPSTNEPNHQGSPQHSSGAGNKPKTQTAKGWQKPLLATPAEGTPYSGMTFVPGPMPPGVGGPLLSYIHPVEGMPPLALMDPTMMVGNLEELGHFHGGLFIPHLPPEGQRMMMPMQGDSPQHVQPLMYQPKQRSRAIPIVAPQANQKGEQSLHPVDQSTS